MFIKPGPFDFAAKINQHNQTGVPISTPQLAAVMGATDSRTRKIVRWLKDNNFVVDDPSHPLSLRVVKVG